MTNEQRAECRRICLQIVKNNNIGLNTKVGQRLVHAFWCGVVAQQQAQGDTPDPWVTILLMSGRQDELMKEEQP